MEEENLPKPRNENTGLKKLINGLLNKYISKLNVKGDKPTEKF